MTTVPPAAGVRLHWDELPDLVRAAIEGLCGSPVVTALTQPGGFSPGVAARVRCANGSRFFVKAVSAEANADSPGLHKSEARTLTALARINDLPVPNIYGWFELGPWVALVLEDIDGRQPTLPWRDADLAAVLTAVDRLSQALTPTPIEAPAIADRLGDEFTGWRSLAAKPDQRLDRWSLDHLDELAALEATWPAQTAGNTLLHCDLRADNLLITRQGVVVVDWPSACTGAAFVDLALMAPSVTMQGGPAPGAVLAGSTSGRAASREALAAVVCALAGYLVERSLRPAPPGLPTVRAFQAAQAKIACSWLAELI